MLFGAYLFAAPALAAPPGCVDLLVDCDPAASIMVTLCAPGPTALDQIPFAGGTVANFISFVRFGPGVRSVTLTQCGTGITTVINSDADLCALPGGLNDDVCALSIDTFHAPLLSGVSVAVLSLMLFAIGAWRQRGRWLRG